MGRSHRPQGQEASALLVAAAVQTHERVLDLGMAGLPVGLDLSTAGVHFVSSDLRAVRLCEDMILRKASCNVRTSLEASPADVSGAPFDVVVYGPARWSAKARVFELIDAAFHKMAIRGRFLLAGRRGAGVESYRKRLEAVFGRVERAEGKSGFRIYLSYKIVAEAGAEPLNTVRAFEVADFPGGACAFEAVPGVFSSDGLDPGTRFLIETAEVQPGDRVLDLGCGYGAIGIAAARRAREVMLLDASLLAIRCAKRNIILNGFTNARVVLSDGFEAVSGRCFDLVLCNAPTHQGTATARMFAQGAARHLDSKGRFIAVAMRPGMYYRQMKRTFGSVERLGSRFGYTVLCAKRPKTGASTAPLDGGYR